jgi:hypothetical protein
MQSRLSRFAAVVAFALIAGLSTGARAADDNANSANVAVDLFAKAGQLAGLPITSDEVAATKQIVACAINHLSAGDCAKNIAVATLLNSMGSTDPAVAKAASCLIGGNNPKGCIVDGVLSQVPAQARPMVDCVINGAGNAAECTKRFVEGVIIDKVPAEFQPTAKCVANGGNIQKCTTDYIVSTAMKNLPPEAKDAVNCIGSGRPVANCVADTIKGQVPEEIRPLLDCRDNVQQCVAKFAASHVPTDGMPPDARDVTTAVLNCMATPDFAGCVKDKAIDKGKDMAGAAMSAAQQAAVDKAVDLIKKLNPDAPPVALPGKDILDNVKGVRVPPANVENIIKVATGISNGQWVDVIDGAGPELVKIAGQIILEVFLSPPLAAALAPVLTAMIDNDAAALRDMLKAIGRGDAVAVATIGFVWYETQFFYAPCSLMPSGDFKATVCGGLADALNFVATNAADLAKALLGAGKDILQWLGVWGTVDDLATGIWNRLKDAVGTLGNVLGIGDDTPELKRDCGSPADYYAKNYVGACLSSATSQAAAGALDTGGLTAACNNWFNRCTRDAGSVASACQAMGNSLSSLAGQINSAMARSAEAFVAAKMAQVANDTFKHGDLDDFANVYNMCAPDFWATHLASVVPACERSLQAHYPAPSAATLTCPINPSARGEINRFNPAAQTACMSAYGNAKGRDALAGPKSDFCKKQIERDEAARSANPCRLVETGKVIDIPGGGTIKQLQQVCDRYRQIPVFHTDRPLIITPQDSTSKLRISGLILRDIPAGLRLPPAQDNNRNSFVRLPFKDRPLLNVPVRFDPAPRIIAVPKLGNPRITAPSAPRLPAPKQADLPRPRSDGPGTGGWNGVQPSRDPPRMQRPPGGSAMDVLGAAHTDGALGGVAGNSGGLQQVRPLPKVGGTLPVPKPPAQAGGTPPGSASGGSGGAYTSKGGNSPAASSGGSGGFNTSKGGNTPARSVDDLTIYGGCSSCNSGKFVQPK